MDKGWSELNKLMQSQIKKNDTYIDGIGTLLLLRRQLMDTIISFKNDLSREDLDAIPFINADGYHSKTIVYSLWHIFRIEDIVAHTLINCDEQVFFSGNYKERIGSPIITTGNELVKDDIAAFSRQLDINELYEYISEVKESTETILRKMPYEMLKHRISAERKEILQNMDVVSSDEKAAWLIDYWCGKDIRGLIQMPFSRHWIMHIEACLRIRRKIHRSRSVLAAQ
ncbi:MAG: phage head-tail adapter protein [Oscillospiraceae bacterium]|nr:phage head-tail adapter protein [Oscillospiraceae bacterium]